MTHRDELRGDGDGDFSGGLSADFESDGGMNRCDQLFADSFFLKLAKTGGDLALAADHSQVAMWTLDAALEDFVVVSVFVGENDDVGALQQGDLLEGCCIIQTNNIVGVREILAIGNFLAVVDYRYVKAQRFCKF